MDLGLTNQVIFVSGSSRGIGKAIAKSFLAEKARVAISGRNADDVRESEQEMAAEFGRENVMSCCGDLTQVVSIRGALKSVYERWGNIDALVANIGSGRSKPGWSVEDDEWQRVFELNFFGSVRLVTETLPGMVSGKGGSIVLVSSIAGIEASPAPLPYSSAKAALINYAKNLARQLAPEGIRVNAVAPGNILFPGGSWKKHLETRKEEVLNHIKAEVPMNRFGTVAEIADAVVFLSSRRATFTTGACLVVDGGQVRSI